MNQSKHHHKLHIYLRIKASSNYNSAEIPKSVFPAHYEKRLVKIGVILPQLFFLNFSFKNNMITETAINIYIFF